MINLEVSDFGGRFKVLNGNYPLNIRRIDLARGLITVGRKSWSDVYQQGLFRIGELACKGFAFSKMDSGNLCLSHNFYSLNQSEKATISYYFGQALTKLFAEKKLNVPWLLHVDGVSEMNYVIKGTAKSKKVIHPTSKNAKSPDLYGLSGPNKIHVLESKGNSGGYSLEIMQHALNQVSQINKYNGVQPLTKTACYFDLSQNPIKGIIIDPDNDGTGVDIKINEEKVISDYYSFFIKHAQYFRRRIRVGIHSYMTIPVGAPDLYFGFDTRILELSSNELLKNGLYNNKDIFMEPEEKVFTQRRRFETSIGTDGIILANLVR